MYFEVKFSYLFKSLDFNYINTTKCMIWNAFVNDWIILLSLTKIKTDVCSILILLQKELDNFTSLTHLNINISLSMLLKDTSIFTFLLKF